MNKLFHILILIIVMFVYTNASNIVGATKGEFSVNQGNASYDLEIVTPKGVAGLKPKLSISYNSANNFNGILGVGFSLNGLSQISKCNQTSFSQKSNSSRNYNYCLDGQELVIKYMSEIYGSNTEYKTKIDSYAKIEKTSSGWIVYKKDGLIYEYGQTYDSRDYDNFYRLNKISDRFNNQINFTYDTTIKKIRQITYANNTIDFIYENRTDTKSLYSRGIKFNYSKRLKKILIQTNSSSSSTQLVSFYIMNYSYMQNKSRIENIQECIGSQCLEPVYFYWDEKYSGDMFNKKEITLATRSPMDYFNSGRYAYKQGDFNGDGLTDLIRYFPGDSSYSRVLYSNGNGTFTESNTNLNILGKLDYIKIGDFNGDGISDFSSVGDRQIIIWLGNGDGTFTRKDTKIPYSYLILPKYLYGDFNGDGLTDIYSLINSGLSRIFISKGDGYFIIKEIQHSSNLGNSLVDGSGKLNFTNPKTGDFNGDGLTDIFFNNSSILYSKGDGTFSFRNYDFKVIKIRGNNFESEVGDFNGDGLTDIYSTATKEGDTYGMVFMSKGDGDFQESGSFGSIVLYDTNRKVIDYNNDGLADIAIGRRNYYYEFTILISNGDGTFSRAGTKYYYSLNNFDVDGNGSLDLVLAKETQNKKLELWLNKNKKLQIKNITNKKDEEITINYANLKDKETYEYDETLQKNTSYPNRILKGSSMKVVKEFTSLNGIGDNVNKTSFFYKDFKINYERGGLGFNQIEITDESKDLKTIFTNNQDYPLTGLVDKKQIIETINNIPLSIIDNEYKINEKDNYKQVYLSQTTEENFDVDGSALTKKITLNEDINEFGQVGLSTTTITNLDNTNDKSYKIVVDSEYETKTINTGTFIAEESLLKERVTKAYLDSNLTNTKTIQYKYKINGVLEKEIIEPTNPKALTKSYIYYANGNLKTEILSGTGVDSRKVEYTYDNKNINVVQIKNSLGHVEKRSYNIRNQLESITDSNGLKTSFSYDIFGNKIKETKADGTYITWDYFWTYDGHKVVEKINNNFPLTVYFNKVGKKIKTEKVGFDGRDIIEEFFYDERGNKDYTYMPYFDGQIPQKIDYSYDSLNRLIETKTPASHDRIAIETVDYDGLKTIKTNAKGQRKRTTVNARGEVVLVEDNIDGSGDEASKIEYEYDAIGNLVKTIDSKNNQIIIEYDEFGNKIKQIDPDMGTWTYTYYPTGELQTQTDAKKQTTTFTYDKLGRVVQKDTPEGVITFVYDTAIGAGKGKIHKEIGIGSTKIYTYDNLGRVSNVKTIIDDDVNPINNSISHEYSQSYTYDNLGRVKTQTQPNGVVITNNYNEFDGSLDSVTTPRQNAEALNSNTIENELTYITDEYIRQKTLVSQYNIQILTFKTKLEEYKNIINTYSTDSSKATIVNDLKTYVTTLENEISKLQTLVDTYNNSNNTINNPNIPILNAQQSIELTNIYQDFKDKLVLITKDTLDAYASQIDNNTSSIYEEALANLAKDISYIKSIDEKIAYYENITDTILSKREDAYSDMLSDTNTIYFYKVVEKNSLGIISSYVSGNGLVTRKEYDDRGILYGIKTGYESGEDIRDLNFEYDLLNNVTRREDNIQSIFQDYTYDGLNRINSVNTIATKTQHKHNITYEYDSIGNITYKSDAGDYTYDSSRPHAVSYIEGPPILSYFTYDANGNMTGNRGRDIVYTSFNKPSKIRQFVNKVKFAYDANNNRYKKYSNSSTTHYIGKSYEKIFRGGDILHRYFIYADGKLVSIFTNTNNQYSIKYLHYDNLGSVDTITNQEGVVEERFIYKPFGERIALDEFGDIKQTKSQMTIDEFGTLKTIDSEIINRGFTGHEHIDEFDFIHMNGRIYDPVIGRFLSADPNIFHPFLTQNFNRYSYTMNNPLKYIDPSGYDVGFAGTDVGGEVGSGYGMDKNDNGGEGSNSWSVESFKDTNGKSGTISYNRFGDYDVQFNDYSGYGYNEGIGYTHDNLGQYTSENYGTSEKSAVWDGGFYAKSKMNTEFFTDSKINYSYLSYKNIDIIKGNIKSVAGKLKTTGTAFGYASSMFMMGKLSKPAFKAAVLSLAFNALGEMLDPKSLNQTAVHTILDLAGSSLSHPLVDLTIDSYKEILDRSLQW